MALMLATHTGTVPSASIGSDRLGPRHSPRTSTLLHFSTVVFSAICVKSRSHPSTPLDDLARLVRLLILARELLCSQVIHGFPDLLVLTFPGRRPLSLPPHRPLVRAIASVGGGLWCPRFGALCLLTCNMEGNILKIVPLIPSATCMGVQSCVLAASPRLILRSPAYTLEENKPYWYRFDVLQLHRRYMR